MENYFEQVLKQQHLVNDDLIGFSEYLDRLLELKDSYEPPSIRKDIDQSPLMNVFGLKRSTVKPSFLFSHTPDIKRLSEFKNYYVEKTFNRQPAFKASFRNKNRDINNDHSFIEKLELLFGENEKYLDKLTDLKTLYHIKQLISKYERKNQLQSNEDFNIYNRKDNSFNSSSFYHQPNKSLTEESSTIIHRLILTSELFSPYEFSSDTNQSAALKSFQIVLHGSSKILKKRLSSLPMYSDIYSSLIEQCDKRFSTLRREIFPQPPDRSIPTKEISMEQIEWLSTKYLPNIFRHRVDWENSLTKRSELIYKLLSYFSKQPDQTNKDWSSIICSQYPVMVKRNGQYMLIFGIRWKPFTNINNTIQSLREKGLYGLEFNTEHFNNFPYFFRDGKECIPTERPNVTSSTLLRDFKKQLKTQIIDRSGTNKYSFPKHPPFRHWVFDFFFNQSMLSKNDFLAVMEGRRSLLEIILKYRPDQVLENQIYQTLITQIEECLKSSRRGHSFKNTIGHSDLKSIQIPDSSKYLSLFLPFYFHIDDSEMLRVDHLFSINLEEYIRYFRRVLSELSDSNLSQVGILDIFEIRESIQENIMYNHKNHINNSLFNVVEISNPSKGHYIIDIIPNLIETIRSNVKFLRLDNLYWKLYSRGLYIPENPILHRDFILQSIKTFMHDLKNRQDKTARKFNTKQEDTNLLQDNLTLMSRFLNLKWKRPLAYVQVMTPSTRLVISKLVKTYFHPLHQVLQHEHGSPTIPSKLVNTIIPFQSRVSTFAIKLLEVTPSQNNNNQEDTLVDTVKTFIGKYKHDVHRCEKQLSNRLLFLFLTECAMRNIITTDNVLPKLALIFKKHVHDNDTCLLPCVDSIEREIISLKNFPNNLKKIEKCNLNTSHLHPLVISNTLMWRNDFTDISNLKALIWNSLKTTNYLINPIKVIIANFEKENTYLWNNMLEQSFDVLAIENIKHHVSSFFPIRSREEEEKEWSVHYKRLQKLGIDYLQYYPFKDLHAKALLSLSKKSLTTTKLEEKEDIIDMFFQPIDTLNSNSRLVLDNSINSLSLKKSTSSLYNRQFGFLYNDLSDMRKPNQFLDDWDLTLTIKCMSRRILRKLKQATQRREILGRMETTFNISSELSAEILEYSSFMIESMDKHSNKESKLLKKFKNITNGGSDKQKFSSLQELIEQVLEFCKKYEISRISHETITDSPEQILLPREQSSYCPATTVRNSINNNEIYSIVPFIERTLTRSKTKEIISNTLTRYEEDDLLFQNQMKMVEYSPFLHYFEKKIQNIFENSFENSFFEKIIDFSYILSYGKVKILSFNHYDESFNSVFITEAEASYMNEHDRPYFYKSSDTAWDILNKDFPSHAICENFEKLETLASEGVDSRMIFGGFCGGDCELLLFHPDCEELKNGNTEMSYLKEALTNRRMEHFGEITCGWMNFDDLVGPGIEMTNAKCGNITRENIWISNECCTFNYNPNKTLEENNKERQAKQKANKGLKYVNHPKRFNQLECGHHHLRETIPLYDLKFLFYSATPFNFKEFYDNK